MPYSDMFCCSSSSQSESKGRVLGKNVLSYFCTEWSSVCGQEWHWVCFIAPPRAPLNRDHLGWEVELASSQDVEQLPGGHTNIRVYTAMFRSHLSSWCRQGLGWQLT